ncbi:MAG: alpha-L-rhamnosidase [Clostridia bacterium]|nr:alpha-L-rhamnosidase [Clostridia bacterium]
MEWNKAKERYKLAEETLFSKNVKELPEFEGNVVRISDCYPGIWMEHSYDPLVLATLYPEFSDVPKNQARIFFKHQREDGQLPAYFHYGTGTLNVGYRQIQECVSFGKICYEVYELTKDKKFLKESYAAFKKWDSWLCDARMTRGKGLIELFCEWDTGHDHALRLDGIPHACTDNFGREHAEVDFLPMLSPDMNAVFYGDRMALYYMADALGKSDEAEIWRNKAKQVKEKMLELLYNKEDEFFYDLDKNDKHRKFKTIMITNVFQEHVLTQDEFDVIYDRYFKSDKHFATPVPFPATSVSDPAWVQNRSGNSWNFYAEALVALRAERWMEHYGKQADYEKLLYKWVECYTESDLLFGQEFHPITGKPSDCSPNYSSALLFFIRAMRKLGKV